MEERNYDQNQSGRLANQAQLEDLLRENLRYSQAIFSDLKKIKRHMMWRTIFNLLWLILILAPLIIAIFWLPQLISDYTKQFQDLTSQGQGSLDLLNQLQQLKQ